MGHRSAEMTDQIRNSDSGGCGHPDTISLESGQLISSETYQCHDEFLTMITMTMMIMTTSKIKCVLVSNK